MLRLALLFSVFAISPQASKAQTTYDRILVVSAEKYYGLGADWGWHKARIQKESSFNPKARNRTDPNGGAWGLGQILAGTGKLYGVQKATDLLDPATNIDVMVHYSHDLYVMFGKTAVVKQKQMLTDASYNWGIGNVLKKYKRNLSFAKLWRTFPAVVRRYGELIQEYRAAYYIIG